MNAKERDWHLSLHYWLICAWDDWVLRRTTYGTPALNELSLLPKRLAVLFYVHVGINTHETIPKDGTFKVFFFAFGHWLRLTAKALLANTPLAAARQMNTIMKKILSSFPLLLSVWVSMTDALAITTFNILAPVHRSMPNQPDPDLNLRESERQEWWRPRAEGVAQYIAEKFASSDVILLQEWWFDDSFTRIFDEAISDAFERVAERRPGNDSPDNSTQTLNPRPEMSHPVGTTSLLLPRFWRSYPKSNPQSCTHNHHLRLDLWPLLLRFCTSQQHYLSHCRSPCSQTVLPPSEFGV